MKNKWNLLSLEELLIYNKILSINNEIKKKINFCGLH